MQMKFFFLPVRALRESSSPPLRVTYVWEIRDGDAYGERENGREDGREDGRENERARDTGSRAENIVVFPRRETWSGKSRVFTANTHNISSSSILSRALLSFSLSLAKKRRVLSPSSRVKPEQSYSCGERMRAKERRKYFHVTRSNLTLSEYTVNFVKAFVKPRVRIVYSFVGKTFPCERLRKNTERTNWSQ